MTANLPPHIAPYIPWQVTTQVNYNTTIYDMQTLPDLFERAFCVPHMEAMMVTYEQTKADFLALEEIAEVDDMVEIDAKVMALMADPTKKRAQDMYATCIEFWFSQERRKGNAHDLDVIEIGDRHGEYLR